MLGSYRVRHAKTSVVVQKPDGDSPTIGRSKKILAGEHEVRASETGLLDALVSAA
jgi:hypothetical protein